MTALAAEEAAAQAESLLDAVGRMGQDLAEARGRIESAVAETRRDIEEARSSASAAHLSTLVVSAEAAVAAATAAAGPEGGEDPLASLRHLETADATLEQALQQVREADALRQERRSPWIATSSRLGRRWRLRQTTSRRIEVR